MSHYDDIRNQIHRQIVPLPILYRDDYSIDHAGLAKYVAWHLENDTQNFCLTFTYSQLDFVTAEEIVDVTRTVMEVVRDDAVFISCTGGGPLHEAIRSVQAFEKIGAHAAFVHLPEHCLQNPSHCGELYVEYIRSVAKETEIRSWRWRCRSLGVLLPRQCCLFSVLKNFAKRNNSSASRMIFISWTIGWSWPVSFPDEWASPGVVCSRTTSFFHHFPNQGEFAGIYNPKRGQRCLSCLMRITIWR